jgi:hypothetical protein
MLFSMCASYRADGGGVAAVIDRCCFFALCIALHYNSSTGQTQASGGACQTFQVQQPAGGAQARLSDLVARHIAAACL